MRSNSPLNYLIRFLWGIGLGVTLPFPTMPGVENALTPCIPIISHFTYQVLSSRL
ncbi:uncharacterized protein BDR25DRAFT_357363 [Lindgomyces ingoldianus]|uniref:Uncharacterized protein n=1 Tax=Lindgomyces ingoldianus TaxID=673940 RepID=A0ACB6QN92_9PLEO|nr:uncharacterized protein BDR25DRAFT_357363 [Lindgomyces ingoldianus]KAF2468423.1 hypothetical protein BDR25DRAFT_357363 [Lindgomyces ingoldianus]